MHPWESVARDVATAVRPFADAVRAFVEAVGVALSSWQTALLVGLFADPLTVAQEAHARSMGWVVCRADHADTVRRPCPSCGAAV